MPARSANCFSASFSGRYVIIRRVAPRLRACTAARCSKRSPNPRRRALREYGNTKLRRFRRRVLVEAQMPESEKLGGFIKNSKDRIAAEMEFANVQA